MFSRGDIVLISYPFTNKAAAKLRPALVVQGFGPFAVALTGSSQSGLGRNAVLLPITSNVQAGQYDVTVDQSHPAFAQTGLKVASSILCWNVNTISKAFVQRRIGALSQDLMLEVDERVRRVLGL